MQQRNNPCTVPPKVCEGLSSAGFSLRVLVPRKGDCAGTICREQNHAPQENPSLDRR